MNWTLKVEILGFGRISPKRLWLFAALFSYIEFALIFKVICSSGIMRIHMPTLYLPSKSYIIYLIRKQEGNSRLKHWINIPTRTKDGKTAAWGREVNPETNLEQYQGFYQVTVLWILIFTEWNYPQQTVAVRIQRTICKNTAKMVLRIAEFNI